MIKQIKKFQIKLTPFDAAKTWNMSTTNNEDLLLWDTASIEEVPLALEYIQYTNTGSSVNFACNIALEQQPDDLIRTRLGLNVSGLFYPDKDPTNRDGTYKRSVFYQVRTTFYNTYKDITKIWGAENIDFNLGKTQRKISDEIRLFDIPTNVFGDKIVPNSVTLINTSADTDFTIKDDGNGNLMAGTNIFAKYQEIGEFGNYFTPGSSSLCYDYLLPKVIIHSSSISEESSIVIGFFSGSVANIILTSSVQDIFQLNIGFSSGSLIDELTPEFSSLSIGFFTGSIASASLIESASVTDSSASLRMTFLFGSITTDSPTQEPTPFNIGQISFYSGSLLTTVFVASGSNDTASITSVGFYSGSLFNTIVTTTGSLLDTASVISWALDGGSAITTAFIRTGSIQDTASIISHTLDSGIITIRTIALSNTEYLSNVTIGFLSGSIS